MHDRILEQKVEHGLIRLDLDFDGTLSGREGSQCVYSELYESLKTNPSARYTDCKFKKNIVELLKAGFEEKENESMKITKDALDFLNTMIAMNADINIISRNREEYIRAVLEAQGISLDDIRKITIRDVNHSGGIKYDAVLGLEKEKPQKAKVTIICDDNSGDFEAMKRAAKDSGIQETNLVYHTASPGKFNWKDILDEALNKAMLAPSVAATMEEKSLSSEAFSNQSGLTLWAKTPKPDDSLAKKKVLCDTLRKGSIRTYTERPGNQYLVFDNEESFNQAVHQLRQYQLNGAQYQEGGTDYQTNKAFDFRVAAQLNTIEFRRQIQRASFSDGVVLNDPLPMAKTTASLKI